MTRFLAVVLSAVLLPPGVASAESPRDLLPIPTPATLEAACDAVLDKGRAAYEKIADVPMEKVSVESILDAWDEANARMEDVIGPAYLMASVHPDPAVRDAAEACTIQASRFNTELFQNEALYRRVMAVETDLPEAVTFRRDLLRDFEDTGISLPPEKRTRLKEIRTAISAMRQEFSRNLRENRTRLTFTREETEGLPESYLKRVGRNGDGSITVSFDYPDYRPFMANARSAEARKRYYIAFNRRGGEENLEILDEVMKLRKELADLYGMPSYAHFALRRKMAEKPDRVWSFLNEVWSTVDEVQKRELAELAALKAEETGGDPSTTRIERWDLYYYLEQYRRRHFDIDQETTRRYFPSQASIDWAIRLAEKLYGIDFQRQKVPVWHPEVQYYDVVDEASGERIAGVYLDPYPRDGKYKHAAAFPVRGVSTRLGRKPISVLVTNFDRKGLSHDEAETLLHEFGHVLHGVLSRTRYLQHAGTSVQRDFVEAPSQIFEEWARRREGLAVMKEVCADCPEMDDGLLERLNQARRFGQGIRYARQHLYASFDMNLVGERPRPALEVWKRLEGARPMGHVPDTQFPGTFGHIVGGYAAGYYGYMWSEVLALDMLSVWNGNLLDPEVGRRFRKVILSRGGERPAREIVEEFLGRPASSEAFFLEITGRRG